MVRPWQITVKKLQLPLSSNHLYNNKPKARVIICQRPRSQSTRMTKLNLPRKLWKPSFRMSHQPPTRTIQGRQQPLPHKDRVINGLSCSKPRPNFTSRAVKMRKLSPLRAKILNNSHNIQILQLSKVAPSTSRKRHPRQLTRKLILIKLHRTFREAKNVQQMTKLQDHLQICLHITDQSLRIDWHRLRASSTPQLAEFRTTIIINQTHYNR